MKQNLSLTGRIIKSFRNIILRNTVYSLLEVAIPFALMLVATPFLLFRMGGENYGIWTVSLTYMGLLGIFDLGLGTAVTKLIAENHEKSNTVNISEIVTTAILLNVVTGLIFTIASFWLSPQLSRLFSSTKSVSETVETIFRLSALGLFPVLLENVSLAIPRGFQDFKTPTLVLLVQNSVSLLAAMFIAFIGGTIVNVIMVTMILNWIFAAISSFISISRLHRIGAGFSISLKTFKTVLRYMLFMGLTGIGIKIFTLLDRVIVAQVLGFSAAGYYIIATGIANKFPAFASAATQSLLPAFSSWNVSHEKTLIQKRLRKATIVIGGMAFIPGIVFLIISRPLLFAWVGRDAGEIILVPTRILVFIYMIKTLTAPSYQASIGLGKPWINAATTLAAGFGTVALIFILGKHYFLVGASWANITSWALFAIVFYVQKLLRQSSYRSLDKHYEASSLVE